MDQLQHGEIRDYGVLYVDENGDYFDPTDTTYEVSHYVKQNGTTNWVVITPETALNRIDLGHFSHTVFVDESIYEIDEVYYIRFRGTDLEGTRLVDERVFKVIAPGDAGGSSLCQNRLTARFVF